MTSPTGSTGYPPPDSERVERALGAMRARRARLRLFRLVGVSGVVVVAAAFVAVALTQSGGHHLRVTEPSSTTTSTSATTTTGATSTTGTTSTTTTTVTSKPGTRQIVYRPYTATGAIDPSLRITSRVTGTCLTGENGRSYRCFGTNPSGGIYDPCFVVPRAPAETLVCPTNPATLDVVELTAPSVPSEPPANTTRPWAFQLAGGQVCLFVSAAWSGLGPYDCRTPGSSTAPADCREPTRAEPWWTAECQDQQTNASQFTPWRVSKAWF